jgi:hypothetical protein
MLEKLLGLGSFGFIVGHLTRSCVTRFAYLGGIGLPLMVRLVAPTFLGYWALIALVLVFHFHKDDHRTFLDVMAHVKTNICPFLVAVQNIHAMLLEVI